MEYGLLNEVATDSDDIGDRILQWGYQRDELRAEMKQNFPQTPNPTVSSTSTSATIINQKPMSNVRPTKSQTTKSNRVVETA